VDEAGEHHLLPDGTAIDVRPLRADDAEALAEGFARLSAQTRYTRFLNPMPRLSGEAVRYLTAVDHHEHEALVAIDPVTRDGVGVARFVRLPEALAEAEFAVTVADEWQGRGVGSLLGEHLAHAARNRGIRRFTATMASDNRAARRLMQKLTRHLEQHYVGGGVDEVVLDLAA